jgi:hypothetical protein
MTILWEFDEKHPKQVTAYGRSPTTAFPEAAQIGVWIAKAFNRIYLLLL